MLIVSDSLVCRLGLLSLEFRQGILFQSSQCGVMMAKL